MSDMLAVEPVDHIEIIAYAYSWITFKMEVPIDLAEDVSNSGVNRNRLIAVAT